MYRLAIFASGNGSNAENIARFFKKHPLIRVDLILSNNPNAFVLERAKELHIPSVVFTRDEFYRSGYIPDILSVQNITHIILAGFLWLVPDSILSGWQGKILNIHPALLPLHGGKGMYGIKVHEAVIAAGERESGITIHYVNERYDEGAILFQERIPVVPGETPESLAEKIHWLEYRRYPEIIEKVVLQQGMANQ